MRKAIVKSKSCSLIKEPRSFFQLKYFEMLIACLRSFIDLCNEMGRLMMLLQVNGTGFLT